MDFGQALVAVGLDDIKLYDINAQKRSSDDFYIEEISSIRLSFVKLYNY